MRICVLCFLILISFSSFSQVKKGKAYNKLKELFTLPFNVKKNRSSVKIRKVNQRDLKKSNIIKDSDGDGIADNIDKCPFEKGSIQNYGCRGYVKKEIEIRTENTQKSKVENYVRKKKDGKKVTDVNEIDIKSKIIEKEAKNELD